MNCPNCKSTDVKIFSDFKTEGKDYNVAQGCLGTLILGPIGLLFGMCGKGKQIETSHFWICENCGFKWEA